MKNFKFNLLTLMLLGGILLFSFESCGPKEKDVVIAKPPKTITPQEAKELSVNFVKDIKKLKKIADSCIQKHSNPEYDQKRQATAQTMGNELNDKKPKFTLSGSSFYTLEEIETYIAYAKQEAASQGYTMDGLRFYFGIFPNDSVKYKKKSGMMSMFISPTGTKNVSEGSMFSASMFSSHSPDIDSIDPLEYGSQGDPPEETYPQ